MLARAAEDYAGYRLGQPVRWPVVLIDKLAVLLILHAAFDVAELDHGEGDHDQHEDHPLGRGAAEVEAFSHFSPVHLTPFSMP